MITSLPNLLTLSRIAAIPIVVLLLLFKPPVYDWIALVVFVIASITDFLDGYLARSQQLVSVFGRFLDPIADKLMVAAVLFMLVAEGHVRGFAVLAALVIVCREVLVSGLREYLAEIRVGLPVTELAKWKTGIQLTAIGFLIVGPSAGTLPIALIGEVGLWLAAALTLLTGYDYLRAGLKHVADKKANIGADG